jgi:hypothetical protein
MGVSRDGAVLPVIPSARRLWKSVRSARTEQVSVVIGLVALLGTLAYSGWSIRQQTKQSKDSAAASEAVLLTTMNESFNRSDERVGQTHAARWLCDPGHAIHSLPRAEELRLWSALNYNDWLAWMLENDRIRTDEATRYWMPRIRQTRRYGYWFLPKQAVMDSYPALARLQPTDEEPCPPGDEQRPGEGG